VWRALVHFNGHAAPPSAAQRDGLTGLGAATPEHAATLGHLMVAASAIAKQEGLDDFRLVTNNGESAGQSVFHLHLHLIGGRPLAWPPG
jgi:histidine triad (HIT) family protein